MMRDTTRRWLERAVIIAAALACIATSAKRWQVTEALPESTSSRIIEVEASSYPTLSLGSSHVQPRTASTTWPGKATFFVPANATFAQLSVAGRCSGGICSSKCVPPKSAFVRVTGSTPVATWRLDASSDPHDILLDPDKDMRTTIAITASDDHTFRIEGDTGRIRDTMFATGHNRMVFWTKPPIRMVVTIRVHVSMVGPCPSEAPCTPPAEAKLQIAGMVTEDVNAPQ